MTMRRLALAGSSVALVVGVIAAPASAAPPATGKVAGAGAARQCSAQDLGAPVRARLFWGELRSAGYSPAAAAGVLGYLANVSGLAPMAIAANRSGWGIAQWPEPRWNAYAAQQDATLHNRWGPLAQITFLIEELGAGVPGIDDAAFRQLTDPAAAARRMHRYFNPAQTASVAGSVAKARAWYRQLSSVAPRHVDAGRTMGVPVGCVPAGVTVSRCPDVPETFKERTSAWLGLPWSGLDPNAQRISRCVYVNFPRIVAHGTYHNHHPVWRRALDLFMPYTCYTDGAKRASRSPVDTAMGYRLADYLIANGRRFGVDYLIWQDQVRSPDRNYWRTDNYNNGDCVNTHFDHLHVSVYRSAA